MVVPVLMTSCQVLLKLKIGPVSAHTTMMPQASENALVLPVQRVTAAADRSSHRPSAVFFLRATMPSLLGGPHYSAPRLGGATAAHQRSAMCAPAALIHDHHAIARADGEFGIAERRGHRLRGSHTGLTASH